MSEHPLTVLRDLVEDPKNNGEYELHLKGADLQRLWKACEDLADERQYGHLEAWMEANVRPPKESQ